MGLNINWARRMLDELEYGDTTVRRLPRLKPAHTAFVGISGAEGGKKASLPLVRDAIAWFDQSAVKFGSDARDARLHRGGYILRLTADRALIAPVTTVPGPPIVKLALPTGAADGMFWYNDPQLQRYVFKGAEHVSLDHYVGTQQGKAHAPTSTSVHDFVRGSP